MKNTKTHSREYTFFENAKIGEGYPCTVVDHSQLVNNKDLQTPSVRDFYVIFRVKKGKVVYHIDFKTYTAHANHLILIAKDSLHYFEPFESNTELQSIVFTPEFIYQKDDNIRHLSLFNIGEHKKGIQLLKLSPENSHYLEVLSQQMRKTYQPAVTPLNLQKMYHLLCLVLLICEEVKGPDTKFASGNISLALEYINIIEKHFEQQHPIGFYAKKLGVSEKKLYREVKAKYKKTPKAILDERRILEIKRLLKGSSQSIKEISYTFEFSTPGNLVKYFKKHTGTTPLLFRKQ